MAGRLGVNDRGVWRGTERGCRDGRCAVRTVVIPADAGIQRVCEGYVFAILDPRIHGDDGLFVSS